MTSTDLHALAERIAREERIEHSAALAILGRRGAAARQRRRNYGTTRPERGAFANVERPTAQNFWWNRND
jgi:hypothetical protein